MTCSSWSDGRVERWPSRSLNSLLSIQTDQPLKPSVTGITGSRRLLSLIYVRLPYAHDFLWRTTRRLPERGQIGIFNRSYYEEVLVVRLHPEILRSQGLSEELRDEKTIWEKRYRSIVDLESHLYRNGTRTVKVFLHLSQEEQRKRFLERIDEPDKNWKFSLSDIHERKYWKEYMKAYEACLNETSTHHTPWYVVPADDKENALLIVSQTILDALDLLGCLSRSKSR